MATLEKIRGMKYLLIGFVGFALLAFIIQGLFSGISFFQDDKNTVVEVNGEAIKAEEYQALLERYIENERNQRPDGTISEIRENQLRNTALNSLIQRTLLMSETQKMGFSVSKEELTSLFLGENISPLIQQYFTNPNTGTFDREALKNYVLMMEDGFDDTGDPQLAYQYQQSQKMWNELEDQVKQQQLYSKFNNFLSAAISTNILDRKASFENNKVKVDFDYVLQPYASIADEGIEVSDVEIKSLYDKKKNAYKQPEARVIDYILVNVVPSDKDLAAERTAMVALQNQLENTDNIAPLVSHNSSIPYKAWYRSYNNLTSEERRFVENNEVGTVSTPIQSGNTFSLYKYEAEKTAADTVAFCILAVQGALDEATIKTKADSLIKVIKSGTSFADVSNAETGGRFNGDYGRHTEQSIMEAEGGLFDVNFKDAVFNAPVNEPVLLKSGATNFIVQVTEKTAPVKKYKVAAIRKEVRASRETRNDTYNKLSRYISTNRDLQSFRDSASMAGYVVYQDTQVTKENTSIGNVEDTRQIIQWAFNNKIGSVSNIYETKDYNYLIVATIQNEYAEGVQSFDQMKDILKRELIGEKKAAKIIDEFNSKQYSSIEQLAEAWNTAPQSVKDVSFGMESNISRIGNEPIIYAEAPLAPVGQLSKPLAGKNGVYVLYVTNKNASDEAYNDETYKLQADMQTQMKVQQLIYNPNLLKENALIEDNSINFPIYR